VPAAAALRGEFGFDQTAAGLITSATFLIHGLVQVP